MAKSNQILVTCSRAFCYIAMCNFPRLALAAYLVFGYDWLMWCLKLLWLVNTKFHPFTFYVTRYKTILQRDALQLSCHHWILSLIYTKMVLIGSLKNTKKDTGSLFDGDGKISIKKWISISNFIKLQLYINSLDKCTKISWFWYNPLQLQKTCFC